jgi:hypothetical protein
MDPYQVLELTPPVTRAEVRAAYHRLDRRWHPDFYAAPGQERARRHAEDAMKQVNAAYRALITQVAAQAEVGEVPPAPAAAAAPHRPPVCPRHAADRVHRCPACGAPACAACVMARTCPACPTHATTPRRRPEEWGWLVGMAAGVVAMHQWHWSPPASLGTLAAYLSLMGVGVLRRATGWGRLLWLLIPYSLVVLGLLRLAQPLRRR